MKKLITFLPINIGKWVGNPHDRWLGLAFVEAVLDWTDLPENCYGKLYVEMRDTSPNTKPEEHLIEVRLAYTQDPKLHGLDRPMYGGQEFVIEGSTISHKGSKRWQLLQSEWFKLPRMPNTSCLWVQGRSEGGICGVALANLAIAQEI